MLRLVTTDYGKLRGLVGKDPRITVFRGVPYAKPPVGDLRWKAPQPLEPWEGVRNCYEYGPMPMMRIHPGSDDSFYTKELHPTSAEYKMGEDCLYMNIFSPAETVDDNIPVFCYIHGGGYQDGYPYEVEFDGERVARRGVIVVMIGYRLGLFGFLAHPEITSETRDDEIVSNFGLQDQSAAIHWVYNNIKAFGGDPSRITVCGQSAGASSIQIQIASPYNEGIITGGIAQSSVTMGFADDYPYGRVSTLDMAEKRGVEFFEKTGIKNLSEARSLSADDLMCRLADVSPAGAMFGFMFNPCIDGKFMTENIVTSYYNDNLPSVPMLVGHCMGETKPNSIFGVKIPEYSEFVKKNRELYGAESDEFFNACSVKNDTDVARLYEKGDFNNMVAGTRAFCELRASQGKDVWYYIFDHDIPGDDAGSFHGSDLWFMFDSLANSWRPFEGKHYDLARQVTSYWTNFVKYGNPNGDGKDYNGNALPEWKSYKNGERNVIRFIDKATPDTLPEDKVIDTRFELAKKLYVK